MSRDQKGPFDIERAVLYSGPTGDDAPHEKSVTLILSKGTEENLKEWESIFELIIFARLESKCAFCSSLEEDEITVKGTLSRIRMRVPGSFQISSRYPIPSRFFWFLH